MRICVAVPAAVWPLRAEEHLGEVADAEPVGHPEPAAHRQRVDARHEEIPGWPAPDWDHVESMRSRYEPWTRERIILDAAAPIEQNLDLVTAYVADRASSPPLDVTN